MTDVVETTKEDVVEPELHENTVRSELGNIESADSKDWQPPKYNTYKVVVKGGDVLGIQFIKNLVDLGNQGGTLDLTHPIRNEFPHSAVMIVHTSERMETDMVKGLEVMPVKVLLSRDELNDLTWAGLKRVAKDHFGLSSSSRQTLTNQYVKAAEDAKNEGKSFV